MADLKTLVQREMDRAGEPTFAFEDLDGLRVRRHRRNRITAAVVGLGLVLILALVGTSIYRSASVPANPPEEPPVDLGIFEPLAGKIVYYSDSSLWGVDPNATDPGSTLVRVALEGTADAEELARFTVPLGWSSDGTKLLLLREGDRADLSREPPYPRYLYILHADGTETQVTAEPVGDAAISPDGSRVVFTIADVEGGDFEGLFIVDTEGGEPVRIARRGASPTFSPDGTRIAYLSRLPDSIFGIKGEAPVWVVNADGTNAHEILADEPALAEGAFGLTWSPAGDRIAIVGNTLEGRVAIYTFAPDGSDFTEVITGGFNPYWSPDGSQIAYQLPTRGPSDAGGAPLVIADADGSDVQVFDFGGVGPWHPGATSAPVGEDALDPTPSRFVGGWAATDYNDHGTDTTSIQTMTIRAGEDGDLHLTVHDDSSFACSEAPGVGAPKTMTGTGRLEDPTTLVVPSPTLTCVDGSDPVDDDMTYHDEEEVTGYTLVLDLATDRLYDSLGVVWNRGAPPESWTDASTEAGVDGPGSFSILHGEVTFRTAGFWTDHAEAYIDPRLFFLIGSGDAEMTILVNPLPPENCDSLRVPPSAEELVQAIRSNPDLDATAPVSERVGGIDALRMDVVAAPGASVGPCTADESVDVVYVPGRPWGNVGLSELGRLYVLDLPGGSARTLAIWIVAPEEAVFEQALEATAPLLESFEFHAS
jgi:Tol biopolymer transport system component